MRRLLATALFCLTALPALALPYTGIYFFGDSLTDTGNVTLQYAALPHPPGAPSTVPGSPYELGGRASNGPIYADVLAAGLGYAATPSLLGGNDYAYSGARTRYQTMGPQYLGILDQVNAFKAQPGTADAGALYVLWGGSNNLQDIIAGRTVDILGNPIPDINGTVGDVASAILGLYAEGAHHLLVPNVADLALVPRVRERGPLAQGLAHSLSVLYNLKLAAALAQLEADHPDLDILAFDTFAALNDLVANAGDFGLVNTTERCYTGDDLTFTGGGSVCATPDKYLFWDGIHPTSTVHGILGREMLAAAAVPEPSTLLLIILAALAAVVVYPRTKGSMPRFATL